MQIIFIKKELGKKISLIVEIQKPEKSYGVRLTQNCWKLKGAKYSNYREQASI